MDDIECVRIAIPAGADRDGLKHLIAAAKSLPRPFDVILVDDTSRLSRNVGDASRIREQLGFVGVRIIAVSQGIDSQDEQSEVLFDVHALVDTLYIKELGKKTHRGLEGLALRGYHTGGNCYGYCNVRVEGGVKLEVNESEAMIVRRIFEMAAAGSSLKKIAKTLNLERIFASAPEGQEGELVMVSHGHPRDAPAGNVYRTRYLEPLQIRKITRH